MRKKKKSQSGIVSYIFALLMTIVFALYMSGRTGWFFFTVMVTLPILSNIVSFIISRFISVKAEISETEIYKNNTVKVHFTFTNNAYIPSPPVEIYLLNSDALTCNLSQKKCIVNIMPRSEQTIDIDFTANTWCAAYAGAEKIKIADYTGLFSFKMNMNFSNLSFKVNIIPDIIDVQASDGLLKNVNDAAAQNDDSEESRESSAIAFNGIPGYEHREYVIGDPIKRINWKLSCKKDVYMVRLDDEILSSKHTVVLDRVNSSGKADDGELCGEYMLGLLRVMARTGIEADVWYYSGGQWNFCGIADEGDVEQLRFSLAGYEFSENADERVPMSSIIEQGHGHSSSLLFYTPCYDKKLSEQIRPERNSLKTDMSVTVAAASIENDMRISEIWLLSKNGYSEIII